jgi:integrase
MAIRLTDKFLGGESGPSKGAMPKGRKAQTDHWDKAAPGLGVRVTKGGKRSFVVWYRFNGKARRDTLKPQYPALSLSDARAEANGTAIDVSSGRDPRLSDRAPRRHYAPQTDRTAAPGTYAEAVEEYIRRYQKGAAQNKTAGEVERCLLKIGAAWTGPLSEITGRDIKAELEAVRDGAEKKPVHCVVHRDRPKPYMANRYYTYLRTFFGWCAEPGIELVERSPMEGMKKPWSGEESRDRVFDDDEIAAIWKAADKEGQVAGALVKVMLLTGKRKTALAAMRRSEIAPDGLWEPPQDNRRKRGTKRLHAIPLPALAHRIVKAVPKVEGNEYVFTGRKDGEHLVPGTSLQRSIQTASKVKDFFFHGLRHTLETRLAELRVLPHIRDLVLDHAPARGAGAGYDHHSYRDEMSEALEAWADYVKAVLVKKKIWQENVEQIGG